MAVLRRLAVGLLVTAAACSAGSGSSKKVLPGPTVSVRSTPAAHLALSSTAFSDGGPIPKQYTCDGTSQSPPLSWSVAPAGTASFSLAVEDPDAPNGGFLHWTVSGIPPSVTSVEAGHPPSGATEGRNGKGSVGYTGPCPPAGQTHHYVFTLKAVAGSSVLGVGELTGTYKRSS
jgi:hypothetical protein